MDNCKENDQEVQVKLLVYSLYDSSKKCVKVTLLCISSQVWDCSVQKIQQWGPIPKYLPL